MSGASYFDTGILETKRRPYPESKDSGVKWFPQLPSTWHTRRLKFLIKEPITDGPHTTPEFIIDGIPFLSVDGIQNGELVFEGCRFISPDDHRNFKKKAFPQPDDILLGKAASTGKIARVKVTFEFSIWSPLALIRPDPKLIAPTFMEYCLKSMGLQSQVEVLCTSNTQKNISMDDIPKLLLPYPPNVEEQEHVARFLDRETAKIDALIAKRQQLIALLGEKRTALIIHAVSKGLDPNVPMKDSGIPAIGRVPNHWEVRRNKWVYREVDERSTSGAEELLSVSHITGVTPRSEKEVYMFLAESNEGYKVCRPNDLAINTMWAYMGAVGVVPQHGIVSPSYNVYRLRKETEHLPQYLDYLYRTPPYISEINRYSKGIWKSRLRLYPDSFFEMYTLTPPLPEQRQIVEHLSMVVASLETLRSKLSESISRLQEYRISLISAAVTGKIDVRGEVP